MSPSDDAIDQLEHALALTPDNHVLRRMIADQLRERGYWQRARDHLRALLEAEVGEPRDYEALALCAFQLEEESEALVLLEGLAERNELTAEGFSLLLRLLTRSNEVQEAVRRYKAGVDAHPDWRDEDFELTYGIGSEGATTDGKVRAAEANEEEIPGTLLERPDMNFESVGGMDAVKEEIRIKVIAPLQHPELFKAYGKAIGGGLLLYGPPGCGKTWLARATAGEINASFLSVGIHDVLDMWIGNSERNLHGIFESARSHNPSVLFFDEVDALGASRTDLKQSGGRHLVNQFLSELDGVETSNDGVLVLAATNAPWHLDTAFRRPGRFDRILFVPPPDAPARAEILRVHLEGKPQDAIDYEAIARKTPEFSGADLKAVVDRAVEGKLQEAMRDGNLRPLGTKDLLKAAKSVKPSTKEWFRSARNYAMYANEGGLYDDVLDYLKK